MMCLTSSLFYTVQKYYINKCWTFIMLLLIENDIVILVDIVSIGRS